MEAFAVCEVSKFQQTSVLCGEKNCSMARVNKNGGF